jgi:hypothetical protein
MHLVRAAVSGIVGVLVGVLVGLTVGYALWGQEATYAESLSGELEKTRAWLFDEIRWSDERHDQISAALTKAQTDLAQVRGELARTRAAVEQAMGNGKSDRLRASEAARQRSTR